jgi:hypothetical protein
VAVGDAVGVAVGDAVGVAVGAAHSPKTSQQFAGSTSVSQIW